MNPQKHSGLGIASFVTGTASAVFLLLLIVIAGIIATSTPGGIDNDSPGAAMLGLGIIAFGGTSLIALALGIAGLVQRDRKKIFPILGTVISALMLLGVLFLLLLGVLTD